jgi:hypothetical protein
MERAGSDDRDADFVKHAVRIGRLGRWERGSWSRGRHANVLGDGAVFKTRTEAEIGMKSHKVCTTN